LSICLSPKNKHTYTLAISPEEDQIDEKELDDLNAEAKMSIEELMAKYKRGDK
jgi:hypothetical protein